MGHYENVMGFTSGCLMLSNDDASVLEPMINYVTEKSLDVLFHFDGFSEWKIAMRISFAVDMTKCITNYYYLVSCLSIFLIVDITLYFWNKTLELLSLASQISIIS